MLVLMCAAAMFRTATAINHLLPYIFFSLENFQSKGIAIRFPANSTSGNLKSFQAEDCKQKKNSLKKRKPNKQETLLIKYWDALVLMNCHRQLCEVLCLRNFYLSITQSNCQCHVTIYKIIAYSRKLQNFLILG